MSISPISCRCKNKKTHKQIFDGGILGNYIINLCDSCYLSQNKKFMITEEKIHG